MPREEEMNTTFTLDKQQFQTLLEAIRGECAPPGLPQPWVEALQERAAKAEAERDAYREERDELCARLDSTLASRDEINRGAKDVQARIDRANYYGIQAGIRWADAHPRIRRFDYAETVTAYMVRGTQEVGG